MNRIIINERDITSNVEALSSFDIVYVPGFSTLPRTEEGPVLVRSRYDFTTKFGDVAPTFAIAQKYEGFDEVAVPEHEEETGTEVNIKTAISVAEFQRYYATLSEPEAGCFYYKISGAGDTATYTIQKTSSNTDGACKTKAESGPLKEHLYTLSGSTYVACTEQEWNLDTTYYNVTGGARMFEAGDADPGYRYALMLLSLGIPVYYEQMNADESEITVAKMYEGLEARFTEDEDPSFDSVGDYSVKYLTSGGYPTFEYDGNSLAEAMVRLAAKRGDALALIDHTNNPRRALQATVGGTSVITKVREEFAKLNDDGSYGAMFTPWYECTHTAVTGGSEKNYSRQMPASLAFLSALSVQLRNYNPWLAVAGVARGQVPYCSSLHTNQPLTNNVADSYQALPDSTGETSVVSINPITNIRNYGYCIWGNRTLRNNQSGTKATSFLNTRNLVSDIKKTLYAASQKLLFEQNTDVLWVNFKAQVTPLLNQMIENHVLSSYKIVKYTEDPETGAPVPAYEVMAVIRIVPINSTEIFDLTIQLENENLNVVE